MTNGRRSENASPKVRSQAHQVGSPPPAKLFHTFSSRLSAYNVNHAVQCRSTCESARSERKARNKSIGFFGIFTQSCILLFINICQIIAPVETIKILSRTFPLPSRLRSNGRGDTDRTRMNPSEKLFLFILN